MPQALCVHLRQARDHRPNTPKGCEECLATGDSWVHLRLCLECGHVGCCDDSPNKHATKHYRATSHPASAGGTATRTISSSSNAFSSSSSRRPCLRDSPQAQGWLTRSSRVNRSS